MTLELQFKIKENESYLRYLRQHDHWYKILNRAPWEFKRFEEEVKKEYHLSKVDRLEKAFNTFEMLEKILVSLR